MKETLSSLMDGELSDKDAAQAMQMLGNDDQLKAAWQEYHLIGDALRGNALLQVDVREQVSVALQAEPTVLAPRSMARKPARPVARFALAASVAMAGVVGWYSWQGQQASDPALMAQAVPTPSAQVQVVNAANQSYLDAHQDISLSDGLARASLVQPAAKGLH
ncbi:sigma-E factor negative regulatory protein [Vogesella sp. DC21W]|uniref:Sigma-E factor negative regulatory protein n=1 Tax=Vogesella aquatica TaxID=2984206 RepID=A0ABT5J089_9NEIS|nr:sigma-E factor negative regulatory protein [Vogesella aquatica]MDC7718242.1 sigma-E factor negative regulatory protein [Vogesella aquatica]